VALLLVGAGCGAGGLSTGGTAGGSGTGGSGAPGGGASGSSGGGHGGGAAGQGDIGTAGMPGRGGSGGGPGGAGGGAGHGGPGGVTGSSGTSGAAGIGSGSAGSTGRAGSGGAGTTGQAGSGGAGTTGQAGSGGAGSTGRAGSGGAGGRGGLAGAAGTAGSGSAGSGGAGSTVIAATPPMGWNSWNTFQCNISESLIEATADAMVSSGMQAAGYEYVNLDDCWMNGRDSSGNLQWNASKFPSGIPALAAYVHGKGLKIGIYETPNTETCVGIYGGISPSVAVGSLGHETADAKTFASWGIDFLKYDLCQGQRSGFATMRDALRSSGRSIVYSINPGNGSDDLCPPSSCSLNLVGIANMWRIGFDINASWASVMSLVDQDAALSSYAGPGHWNDPDMLEVGNGLAANEDQSHFSMWAMLAAPLLAGNDIRSMSGATRAVLTNTDVIAVDQDPLGAQGKLVATPAANLQIWSKTLSGTNARAVALLNRTSGTASITAQWTTLGLPAGSATVRDLWNHTDLGTIANAYTATAIPSHGVVMLKVISSP
jgi:Alpha galactosidase A/Alpha galactosidase C-terminal beta sandwich domain